MNQNGFNFHNLPLEELFHNGRRWDAGNSGRNGGQETEADADQAAYYITSHVDQLIK